MLEYERIDISEGLMLIKQIYHDLMQKAIGFYNIAIVYIKKMLTEFIFSI